MDSNHLWTVTIDGSTSTAPDASAVVGILLAALGRHTDRWPMLWRIDRNGSAVLVGAVCAARPGAETEYDDWATFWADSIRQQLGQAPGVAS